MNETKGRIRDLVSKGVSSKILLLLLSVGPLRLKQMQKILHPSSSGSGQISTVKDELLDLDLIELKKVKIKPFKEFKITKFTKDGLFTHRPIYGKKVTGILAYVPTFRWLEYPYDIKLNEHQKDFLEDVLREYAFSASMHENNFSYKTGFDLYEIIKWGINDQLAVQTVCSLFYGENYGLIIEQEIKAGREQKLDDTDVLNRLAKKCPVKLTKANRCLFYLLQSRINSIPAKDLVALADLFTVKSEKDAAFLRHDFLNTFLWALKENIS